MLHLDSERAHAELVSLASKTWRHPTTGLDVAFGASTLERWYYAARRAPDPVASLKDRLRGDVGRFPSLTPDVIDTQVVFSVACLVRRKLRQWLPLTSMIIGSASTRRSTRCACLSARFCRRTAPVRTWWDGDCRSAPHKANRHAHSTRDRIATPIRRIG